MRQQYTDFPTFTIELTPYDAFHFRLDNFLPSFHPPFFSLYHHRFSSFNDAAFAESASNRAFVIDSVVRNENVVGQGPIIIRDRQPLLDILLLLPPLLFGP